MNNRCEDCGKIGTFELCGMCASKRRAAANLERLRAETAATTDEETVMEYVFNADEIAQITQVSVDDVEDMECWEIVDILGIAGYRFVEFVANPEGSTVVRVKVI